jgi:hypothetical protein
LARGKIIYGDASGDPAALAAGTTDGHVLTIQNTNGDMAWEAPASGGGTVTGVTGTSPINSDGSSTTPTISIDDATTSAKGAASFSSDNFAVSSGAVTIKTGGVDLTDEVTGSLPDGNIASAATWNAKAASGANGDITELTGLTTALTVAQGGTGATSLTDKAVLISQDTGTDAIGAVALTSNGQIIVGGADGPAAATITAGTNVSVTNAANSITIASTDEFTGTVTSVSGGTGLTGTVTGSGSIALDLDSLTDVTGVHNNGWGAGDTVAIVDADSDGSRQVKMPAEIGIACSDETTLLTAGVKAKITVPRAMTVTEVKLSLNVADDTGLAISLEDREADPESTGTSMLDEDLNSGTDYTATATSFDSAASSYSLDEDDFVSVEITDIGGGEAKGLKVWLLGYWT